MELRRKRSELFPPYTAELIPSLIGVPQSCEIPAVLIQRPSSASCCGDRTRVFKINLFCCMWCNLVLMTSVLLLALGSVDASKKPHVHGACNCSFQSIICVAAILFFFPMCHKPAVLCTLHCTYWSGTCSNDFTVTFRMIKTSMLFYGS